VLRAVRIKISFKPLWIVHIPSTASRSQSAVRAKAGWTLVCKCRRHHLCGAHSREWLWRRGTVPL